MRTTLPLGRASVLRTFSVPCVSSVIGYGLAASAAIVNVPLARESVIVAIACRPPIAANAFCASAIACGSFVIVVVVEELVVEPTEVCAAAIAAPATRQKSKAQR